MAITVSRFTPPSVRVSITDGQAQVTFDTPGDMWDYLDRHPELVTRLPEFSWWVDPGDRRH